MPDLPKIPEGVLDSAIKEMQYSKLAPEYKTHPNPDDKEKEQECQAELDTLKNWAKLTEKQINDLAAQPIPLNQAAPPTVPAARAVRASVMEEKLFGDYAPSGYSYKPWGAIFPELERISKLCTTSQVVFGHSLVWFSIRGVFAQYLEYCVNYPDVVGDGLHIRVAANVFRLALNAVSEFLTDSLRNRQNPPDLTFLQRLEGTLKKELDDRDFGMYDHYRFWIDNYEWLKKVPFGVVAVVERGGQHFYQENPCPGCPLGKDGSGFTPTDSIAPADLIDGNAYRLYPIISTDFHRKPYFVWVGVPSRLKGDHGQALTRSSERLTLGFPAWHKDIPEDEVFEETVLPMLIHQSNEGAEEIARAENDFRFFPQFLTERWENRKSLYGMNLYPRLGSDENLLQEAGRLAHEASQYGTVLPDKDETTGEYGKVWRLRKPEGAWAAYFPPHDAMFFWGPADGAGWDLFERCEIRLVPINYDAVRNAGVVQSSGFVKSGGRPMWLEPRTDELLNRLHALAAT